MANELVDDRCESDISGVATDDTDLSTVSNIGDVPLSAGDVVRSYRHQPNPSFNAILTYCTIIALLFAFGIGIGHYMGKLFVTSFVVVFKYWLHCHFVCCYLLPLRRNYPAHYAILLETTKFNRLIVMHYACMLTLFNSWDLPPKKNSP